MKLIIDQEKQKLEVVTHGESRHMPLYCDQAFELISQQWLEVGWNQKYMYTFSWLGRPVIQLPEDMLRTQEVLYRIKPDVILETGIAHGGSLIYYASLCKAMGKGRVIGVDIEIRPHNRFAIEAHELSSYITLIEGNSVDSTVVGQVHRLIEPEETVLVILDSCHTREHVAAELDAYHDLVSRDSYIVTTDGSMRDLSRVPRGEAHWRTDNPVAAAEEFIARDRRFIIEQPNWPFNESGLSKNITHWPSAWLKRIE